MGTCSGVQSIDIEIRETRNQEGAHDSQAATIEIMVLHGQRH